LLEANGLNLRTRIKEIPVEVHRDFVESVGKVQALL